MLSFDSLNFFLQFFNEISGVFEMPTSDNVKQLSKPLPFSLICDNIRVPGNLGAILRVAVGAGCEKVILSKGLENIH